MSNTKDGIHKILTNQLLAWVNTGAVMNADEATNQIYDKYVKPFTEQLERELAYYHDGGADRDIAKLQAENKMLKAMGTMKSVVELQAKLTKARQTLKQLADRGHFVDVGCVAKQAYEESA